MNGVRLMVLSIVAPCFALPARAGDVAVAPLEASGPVAEADVAAASDAVAAELRLSYDEVLQPADARAGIEARSPGCLATRDSCVAAALDAMGWPRFVSGRVSARAGGADLELELFESATGRRLARASRSTTAGDRAGLVALGRLLVRDLGRAAEVARKAHLVVDSHPAGATVLLNGQAVGRTPWTGEVEPGRATLVVELEGRAASRRELVLDAGGSEQVNVAFAASGTSREGRPILGPLILGVVGLGLLAVDAVTLALEGCEGQGAGGTCRRLAPAPVAVYGIGGVIAVGSAVVWYLLGGGSDDQVSQQAD